MTSEDDILGDRQHAAAKGAGAIAVNVAQYGTATIYQNVVRLTDAQLSFITVRLREASGVEALPANQPETCPYPGLDTFLTSETKFFAGREEEVAALAAAVDRFAISASISASGAGKSSLVNAGLIPALGRRESEKWDIFAFRPGREPLKALSRAISAVLERNADHDDRLGVINRRVQSLRTGEVPLRDHLELLRTSRLDAAAGRRYQVLFFIDQWEELYIQTDTESDRGNLIRELLDVTERGLAKVLLTMRADFMGDLLEGDSNLLRRVKPGICYLEQMTETSLRAAILKPAAAVGLRVPEKLTSRLIADTRAQPGALPYLQFVLRHLWEQREKSTNSLTTGAYDKMEGLKGAIGRHASRVLKALTEKEQQLAAHVIPRLVNVLETGEPTSRRLSLSDLDESSRALLRKLAEPDKRLIVLSAATDDAVDSEIIAEVAHEALLREWNELKGWIADRGEFFRLRNKLEAEAKSYQLSNKNRAFLNLKGKSLADAKDLLKNARPNEISETLRNFIRANLLNTLKIRIFSAGLAVSLLISIALAVYLSVAQKVSSVELAAQRQSSRLLDASLLAEEARALASHGFVSDATRKVLAAADIIQIDFNIIPLGHPLLRAAVTTSYQVSSSLNAGFAPGRYTSDYFQSIGVHAGFRETDLKTFLGFSLESGKELYSVALPANAQSMAADQARNQVYIFTERGDVYRFDARNGDILDHLNANLFDPDAFEYVDSIGLLFILSGDTGVMYNATAKNIRTLTAAEMAIVRKEYVHKVNYQALNDAQEGVEGPDVTARQTHIRQDEIHFDSRPRCTVGVTGGKDGVLRFWSLRDAQNPAPLFTASFDDRIVKVDLSPRCDSVIVSAEITGLSIFDIARRRVTRWMPDLSSGDFIGYDGTGAAVLIKDGNEVGLMPMGIDLALGGARWQNVRDFRPGVNEFYLSLRDKDSAPDNQVHFATVDASSGATKCEFMGTLPNGVNPTRSENSSLNNVVLVGGAGCNYYLVGWDGTLFEVRPTQDWLSTKLTWIRIADLPREYIHWPTFWTTSRVELRPNLVFLPGSKTWRLVKRTETQRGSKWMTLPNLELSPSPADYSDGNFGPNFNFADLIGNDRLLLGDSQRTLIFQLSTGEQWERSASVGCLQAIRKSGAGEYYLQEYGGNCKTSGFRRFDPITRTVSEFWDGLLIHVPGSSGLLLSEGGDGISVRSSAGDVHCNIVDTPGRASFTGTQPGQEDARTLSTVTEGGFAFSPHWHDNAGRWFYGSLDQSHVVFGANNRTISIWSSDNCAKLVGGQLELISGAESVGDMAVNISKGLIAFSTSDGGSVSLWSAQTGSEVLSLSLGGVVRRSAILDGVFYGLVGVSGSLDVLRVDPFILERLSASPDDAFVRLRSYGSDISGSVEGTPLEAGGAPG